MILLDHAQLPQDPVVSELVERLQSPHRSELDERIGTSADWLIRAQTIAGPAARKRDQASPVDSLFADIVREVCGAEIAFLPGVGYGVAIPPGPITAAQLRQLVPHEGKLITMTLMGDQVRSILEQALENVYTDDPKMKVGGMIQVAGLRFRYDRDRALGRRITEVQVGGKPMDDRRVFRVATNSMLAKGGHRQRTFLDGKDIQERGSQYEAIKTWIRQHSPIKAPIDARIQSE